MKIAIFYQGYQTLCTVHVRVNCQLFVYITDWHVRPPMVRDKCQLFVYPTFVYILLSRSSRKSRNLADGHRLPYKLNFLKFLREQNVNKSWVNKQLALLYGIVKSSKKSSAAFWDFMIYFSLQPCLKCIWGYLHSK